MQGCISRWVSTGLLLLASLAPLNVRAAVPATWVDDAQLHDVQFVGSRIAFAVGDHGAIWKSIDGGENWTGLDCGLDATLRSVCFLSDEMGWIAGGEMTGFRGQDRGVLLATTDGGKTWNRLGAETLTVASYVRFFSPEEGVVVGQPSGLSSSGVFRTGDGGKTWQGIAGNSAGAWKVASFVEPSLGAVGGVLSRVSLLGGEQMFASKLAARGSRSIRALKLLPDETGWLAGDGGLVLKSANSGVVWDLPPGELPEELRETMDFRAVDVRENKVWLAGAPGSVVWHSPDGGQRWFKQLTGQPAPLTAIRFANELTGLAVGAFGSILKTTDGGRTWESKRAHNRRAAFLAVHSRIDQTTPELLVKLSGEGGYRGAVWVAQRNDLGPLAESGDGETRFHAAIQKSGSNAAEVYWQLPQTIPGIEFSSEQLLAAWTRQTEGKLPQRLLGHLVRQIRTWQPTVVIIDQPSPEDAASQLIFDAILRAIPQAADATRYLEQSELAGLAPWNVERVYLRLSPGATGDTHVELDELLPHLRTSVRMAAVSPTALLTLERVPSSSAAESTRIAYRWIGTDGMPFDTRSSGNSERSSLRARDFFGGMLVTPGSAARRDVFALQETDLERVEKLIQRQRNLTAITHRHLDDPRMAGQMIGQLNRILAGMEPDQAAAVLRDLADEYRKRSQFELVEATYVELIQRCPQEPGAIDAMRWLIQFWSSTETAWQRTRQMNSTSGLSQSVVVQDVNVVDPSLGYFDQGGGNVQQAVATETGNPRSASRTISPTRMTANLDLESDPSKGQSKASGRLRIAADRDWRSGAVGDWQNRAAELAKKLQKASPTLFVTPEIQFPLAVLRRVRGSSQGSDEIMRGFVTHATDPATQALAERELWASFATPESPKYLLHCQRTPERPYLDGVLSEPCWQDAKEIYLADADGASLNADDPSRAMTMLAYDNEFLYFACSVPRAKGPPADAPQLAGREHDADLLRHDRITLRLDLDRDYATWYEFQLDQRGWTTDACWEDRRWNPRWFVAAEGDASAWRLEVAIPWQELTPSPPRAGTTCGLSLLRTTPGVGLQSWTQPAVAQPRPSSFGLVKFE